MTSPTTNTVTDDSSLREALVGALKQYIATEHGKRAGLHAEITRTIFRNPIATLSALSTHPHSEREDRPTAREEWQPIETAPKGTGERVLLSLLYENGCLPRLTIEGANYEDGTWHWPGRKTDSRYRPTHWQPLPKPPSSLGVPSGDLTSLSPPLQKTQKETT